MVLPYASSELQKDPKIIAVAELCI